MPTSPSINYLLTVKIVQCCHIVRHSIHSEFYRATCSRRSNERLEMLRPRLLIVRRGLKREALSRGDLLSPSSHAATYTALAQDCTGTRAPHLHFGCPHGDFPLLSSRMLHFYRLHGIYHSLPASISICLHVCVYMSASGRVLGVTRQTAQYGTSPSWFATDCLYACSTS